MITVLHHIVFSLLLRSFSNLSSLRRPGIGTLVTQPSQTSFAVLSDVINDSYNYGKQVCLFLEGCGLINYIFIVVFLLLTHLTYLLFSNRGSPFLYLTLLFQFVLIVLPVINEPKIHLFPVIYYKSGDIHRYRV
jgi:hypothetical protein